ncbi:ATP-binding protein [Deinococcus pimensis]|uniref:ATP-binding protein n=1 Tax=Deinococcus pimensis TaxID=309888 RepID=UPI0004812A24|nr:ATP-binding protein [Deinococcus pimensis]
MTADERALITVRVDTDDDLVGARALARRIAEHLRLGPQDTTRVATVVSELARNALRYAHGGAVTFGVTPPSLPRALRVTVRDHGGGIPDLDRVLGGTYRSRTGMGVGLAGSRGLMDAFHVDTSPEGTTVCVEKHLPTGVTDADVERAARDLLLARGADPVRELQAQNHELMDALAALAEREERLRGLNQELEDTNRGVVALYGELEEKAERLREANQLKTMFLSYMSHEFRTPLNSVLGLTRMLLARLDGELTPEQHKQVSLIAGAAGDLLGMVNDLLDVAKVEAGKSDVHVSTFRVDTLFATLRALFQPILTNPDVRLVLDDARDLPPLTTDEGKVSQVLRNFVSNALKFTPRGEVRVHVALVDGGRAVRFEVRDTGIGIPVEEQGRLFQDFTQVRSRPGRAGGTGLGLSLARKLTELLGGTVGLTSEPGRGSVFHATFPVTYAGPEVQGVNGEVPAAPAGEGPSTSTRPLVLLVDDNEADRYLLGALLAREHFDVREEGGGEAALRVVRDAPYRAVLLDLSMPDLSGLDVLARLRADPATRALPVLIVTSQVLTDDDLARGGALGATFHAKDRLYQGDTDGLVSTLWAAVRRAASHGEDAAGHDVSAE